MGCGGSSSVRLPWLCGEVCEGPSPEASERPGLEGRARLRGALGTQPRLLTPVGRAVGHAGAGVGVGIQKADHTGAGGVQAVQEGARRPGAGASWVSARAPRAALGGPPPRRVRHRVLVSQGPGSSLALEGPAQQYSGGPARWGPQHSHLALGLRLRPVGSERNSIFRRRLAGDDAKQGACLRVPRHHHSPGGCTASPSVHADPGPCFPAARPFQVEVAGVSPQPAGSCPPAQAGSLGLLSPPPPPPGPALRPLPYPHQALCPTKALLSHFSTPTPPPDFTTPPRARPHCPSPSVPLAASP